MDPVALRVVPGKGGNPLVAKGVAKYEENFPVLTCLRGQYR